MVGGTWCSFDSRLSSTLDCGEYYGNGTKVEVRTVDGTEFVGIVIRDDESKIPDYVLLSDVWISKPDANPTKKKVAFIMTRNIAFITNA